MNSETSSSSERDARLSAEIERRIAVTPAMLHSIDDKGRIISVSDLWLAKLGYEREEVIGRPSTDFLAPESRERAARFVLPEFFKTGRCDNVEYQMVRKDGGVIDVLLSGVLDFDPVRNAPVSLAVITDVTSLKIAERKLTESEARYRGLVEDQSEFLSLAAPDGDLIYVNPAYANLYGLTPGELIGRNIFEFIPPESRAEVREHFRFVCAVSHSVESKNQAMLPNGERRWTSWTNRALRDAQGAVTAIHSVGRDIEERVRADKLLQESESRYRFLAENTADMILLVGIDGRRSYASPACRALLGYEPEEMLQIRTKDAVHPDDAPKVLQALAAATTGASLTYRMRRKDGRYVWVETSGRLVNFSDGEPKRLVIVRNIEQRVAAEQRLKDSEARYRLLADNSTDVVLLLDLDLSRRYVSPACREIFGYEPEELLGAKTGGMAHPDDAAQVAQVLKSLLSGQADRQTVVARRRHRDGRWIWIEAKYRLLRDAETGSPIGIVGTIRDISARKAIEEQLAEAYRRLEVLAREDGLTGLANRRVFDDSLVREFRRAYRAKKSLALIMIDVDQFKPFNDQYGHPAGDECLRLISGAIKETARRPGDLATRYGGEEFAVLLPDTDESGASEVAERIRRAVADLSLQHDGVRIKCTTISAGVAAVTPQKFGGSGAAAALVDAADRALYRAKRAGRNAVIRASAEASSTKSSSAA
ncbi:MAG TPA: PAS domain S-box protein [Roseiarcus sp.]|nr:PAS domain S-box protein [Roseiarcus sp.]